MAKFSEIKMQEIRDRTIAKVLWGEHKNLTIEFLRKEGLGGPEIGEILDEAYAEKAKIQRRNFIAKTVSYIFGVLVFGAIVLFCMRHPEMLQTMGGRMVLGVAIVACSGCLSLVMLTLIDRIRNKGKDQGAVLSE